MHKIALEWVEEGRSLSQAFSFDKLNEPRYVLAEMKVSVMSLLKTPQKLSLAYT